MAVNKKKGQSNLGTGVALGAGLIATLVGGYFLYGPNGNKNRKQIKAWSLKAKGEVLSEIEKMKEVTSEKYDSAVEKVMSKYAKLKDIDASEIEGLKKDLKKYWKNVQSDLKKKGKKVVKTAKKTSKNLTQKMSLRD